MPRMCRFAWIPPMQRLWRLLWQLHPLAITPGKPLVNSVNGEEHSLESILPLIKEHGAAVIGLTMDDDGIPESADGRLAIADPLAFLSEM